MDLRMINSKVITSSELEDIQYLDTYELTEKAYEEYTTSIKWNEYINYNDAKKKIIRNILLSREAPANIKYAYKRLFYYGNLSIGINEKEKSIYYIQNNSDMDFNFNLDEEKRKTLNYIMGIED